MKFRRAEKRELEEIYKIFQAAIEDMGKKGIPQWDDIYPDREILREDIEKEQLYIGILEDKIASVYVINKECDEQYANGEWNYPNASYCIIHRLCVNPEFQKRGIGSETVKYIEKQVINAGIETIRLDAFTQNPYALKMYEKLNYIKRGFADFRKGKFYLMEKRVIIEAE